MSPARLKVVEKEQQPARSDHAVGLSQRGFAVVHVADGQGADHGVECVVAEREPVTVGDSYADRPTQLMGTLRRDLESLAVEIYRDQFDVGRVPPEVESGADPDLQGSPPGLATYPLTAVPDRQPLAAVPGATI